MTNQCFSNYFTYTFTNFRERETNMTNMIWSKQTLLQRHRANKKIDQYSQNEINSCFPRALNFCALLIDMTRKQITRTRTEAVEQRCSVKKVFQKISQNSQANSCTRVSAGLRPATLLKKRFWHRCLPLNFEKFLGAPFFIEHLWWLLLKY